MRVTATLLPMRIMEADAWKESPRPGLEELTKHIYAADLVPDHQVYPDVYTRCHSSYFWGHPS